MPLDICLWHQTRGPWKTKRPQREAGRGRGCFLFFLSFFLLSSFLSCFLSPAQRAQSVPGEYARGGAGGGKGATGHRPGRGLRPRQLLRPLCRFSPDSFELKQGPAGRVREEKGSTAEETCLFTPFNVKPATEVGHRAVAGGPPSYRLCQPSCFGLLLLQLLLQLLNLFRLLRGARGQPK